MDLIKRPEYIQRFLPMAIKATAGTGIFPETLMAQDLIESSSHINGYSYPGQSVLASQYNNHFGIKAGTAWHGDKVLLSTKEGPNSEFTIKDWFRAYPSQLASYKDYVKFLQDNPRYAKVFTSDNYSDQIMALAKAGYATDSHYAAVVTEIADMVTKYMSEALEAVKRNKKPVLLIVVSLMAASYFYFKKK